jgi:hypothetical protein
MRASDLLISIPFPTRHPDPERSEGEGPHAMGSVITFVAERGTSCNVHAKHELPRRSLTHD